MLTKAVSWAATGSGKSDSDTDSTLNLEHGTLNFMISFVVWVLLVRNINIIK